MTAPIKALISLSIVVTAIFFVGSGEEVHARDSSTTPGVSAGQKCFSAGAVAKSSKGNSLVCTKEGSRLIWRKAKSKVSWSDVQIVFGGYCGQSLTYSRRDNLYTEIQRFELVKVDSSRAVTPLSYNRFSRNLLFQVFNCNTRATSLFTLNLATKDVAPSLIVALPPGQGISDAIIDPLSGTVVALTYGSGLSSYVATQYLPTGPVQIWSANNSGWFRNGLTFPSKLVASTGGQFFIAGSNSSSNSWRIDSVSRSGTTGVWYSQNALFGSGTIADIDLDEKLAVYTNESLFICNNFTSISVVNNTTCSVVPEANPADGQRKMVWAFDPKAGGRSSLWISGNNVFVDPTSMKTTPINLTGCIFGCGMGLVGIPEIGLDLLPTLRSWIALSDVSFG